MTKSAELSTLHTAGLSYPLFLVGAPRSGTTLIRALLNAFSGVFILPDEFQVLPKFARLYEQNAKAGEVSKFLEATNFAGHLREKDAWLDACTLQHVAREPTAADAFRSLVHSLAAQQSKEKVVYWGDKTPENVFQLKLIHQLWPQAKVLQMVRSPVDTVVSMNCAWGRSAIRSSVICRDAARAGLEQTYFAKEQYRIVKYESLLDDPSRTLKELGAWLSVPIDLSIVNRVATGERWGDARDSIGVHTPYEARVARDERQTRLVESICRNEMIALGYEPIHDTTVYRPSELLIKTTRLLDAARVVSAYTRERGVTSAVKYKLKQWLN